MKNKPSLFEVAQIWEIGKQASQSGLLQVLRIVMYQKLFRERTMAPHSSTLAWEILA